MSDYTKMMEEGFAIDRDTSKDFAKDRTHTVSKDEESFSLTGFNENVLRNFSSSSGTNSPVYWGELLEHLLSENIKDFRSLLDEYKIEFRPIRGKEGYVLTGVYCSDKECHLCPHYLRWRKYDYRNYNPKTKQYLFLWASSKRLSYLPSGFHRYHKNNHYYERFVYYNDQMKELNAKRALLVSSITKMRHSFYSVFRSKLFS